jgi:penicillin-binding protein 2
VLLGACFAVLVLRLWSLQVVHAERYRELALHNRVRDVKVRPARGRVFDRNGRPLADNRPRLDACVDYSKLKSAKHSAEQRERLVAVLHDVLGMSEEEIGDRLDPRKVVPYVPVVIERDITPDEYAKLKVLEPLTAGLMPMTNFARRYRYGAAAAQALGYTGLVPGADELDQLCRCWPELDYDGLDVVGLAGLELEFEHELQGHKGWIILEVDNRGRRQRVVGEKNDPVPGNDIYTTLDIELQELAQRLLGEQRGAIVAMDPRNGDVLVLASTPGFDPNVFAIPRPPEAVAEIQRLNKDETRPLWNRCISDSHPLGSAFKVVVALAALNLADETKRMPLDQTFDCDGTFRLPHVARVWHCYHSHAHGEMTFATAIKKSCNVFFYNVGSRIGREPIVSLAAELGLGKPTGVPLPSEEAGVNPTDEWLASGDWRATDCRDWTPGWTVNLSIGQFPVEVTPIQVAQLYSTVAMDGVQFAPRLVTKIVRPDGVEEFAPQSRRIEFSPESLALVKEGLREVTRPGGTAYTAFQDLDELHVAGKTSTAEVGTGENKPNLVWFISFAPVEAPEIVLIVMVEEGDTGGGTAAPLAAEFLKTYFAGRVRPAATQQDGTSP